MTTELTYLAWTALLTVVLWIPYVVCQAQSNGMMSAENYRDPTPRPVPLWGHRANRAHLNAVESFAPFAALVLIIHATGQANGMTALWAALFFWARLAHAVIYIAGIAHVRTLAYLVAFVATLGLAYEALV